MNYLLDSSSLLFLIRSTNDERKMSVIKEAKVLDLTYYEIGNAVWKESSPSKSLSGANLEKVVEAVNYCFTNMESISLAPVDLAGILEIARKEKLTFYNSSYLYATKKNNLTLVTEDEKLARASKKYTRTRNVLSLKA